MNRVILMDDRPKRMSLAIEKNGQDFNLYKSIEGLEIPLEQDCINLKEEINNGSGKSISNYSLIIAHQSAFSGTGLNILDSTCKSHKINLILFSGSIRQPVYYAEKEYRKLIINSKDLYSENLVHFIVKVIKNEMDHLTELIYADKWKLGIALTYRQLLIDQKYGDDIRSISHKNKQLLNCISILGECTEDELSSLINEQIQY